VYVIVRFGHLPLHEDEESVVDFFILGDDNPNLLVEIIDDIPPQAASDLHHHDASHEHTGHTPEKKKPRMVTHPASTQYMHAICIFLGKRGR